MTSYKKFFTSLNILPGAGQSQSSSFLQIADNVYGFYLHLKSDKTGTLTIDYSDDGVSTTDTKTYDISTYSFNDRVQIFGKYAKFTFTNEEATANTTFALFVYSLVDITQIQEVIIDDDVPVKVNIQNSSLPVSVDTTTLEGINTGINSNVVAINSTLAGTLTVDGSASTQPISAVSLPLPTGAATESTLSTLNGKITACDTSALATEATLSSVNSALSGTLTVDGSASTQPISAVSLPLPTGAATEATLSSVNSALTGTLTVDGSASTQPISAVSLPLPTGAATESTLGSIETEITTLAATVNQNGEQKVSVSSENYGTYNNVANNITLNAGATTSALSIAEIARGNLFYEDSSTSTVEGLEIQVSADNTNWHTWGELLPYTEPGASIRTATVLDGSAHGLKYIRLKNISSSVNYSNVKCSIYGSH